MCICMDMQQGRCHEGLGIIEAESGSEGQR